MFFLLLGCAAPSSSSELLTLAHIDEKIVDFVGPETDAIYDPLNLLKRGEAYRVKKDYPAAARAYTRFLELYPFHRLAALAQYSLGLCYFYQIRGIDRDPTPSEQARAAFQNLLTDFPESLYAKDAALKSAALEAQEAASQFNIGHFYFKKKAYPAAIARFHHALQKTKVGQEGIREKILYYMGRSYDRSGNRDQARSTFQTLQEEYPDSLYLRRVAL